MLLTLYFIFHKIDQYCKNALDTLLSVVQSYLFVVYVSIYIRSVLWPILTKITNRIYIYERKDKTKTKMYLRDKFIG